MLLSIKSRHPSCNVLRKQVRVPDRAIYRHGSTTKSDVKREINSIESIRCASSKLLMKEAFDKGDVKHLRWARLSDITVDKKGLMFGKSLLEFPVVIKNNFGSRGEGNYKIDNIQQFNDCIKGKVSSHYIVEEFFSGSREYRVHVTSEGAVYSLRKLLKDETPKDKRWVRNDATCVWICEFPPSWTQNGEFQGFQGSPSEPFDKPVNWDKIVQECKKALKATGLDIGAVDLKVQSAKEKDGKLRKDPEFYIIEINSAPAMGKITAEVYKKELPKILFNKYGRNKEPVDERIPRELILQRREKERVRGEVVSPISKSKVPSISGDGANRNKAVRRTTQISKSSKRLGK